jgi:hypothetical protein
VLRAIRLDRFIEEAGFNPVEGYFNHNPGEPQTYMSRSEMESLGNDFTVIATTKDSNGNTSARLVPEHPSSISESFALSNYGSTSLTLTQSLNSFTKIKGGTAYVEVGIEYSFSASAAITYGSTAFYSWTVGGMPPEYYDDVNNHFSAGAIFYTHETQSGGGQKFHTLNFWVE